MAKKSKKTTIRFALTLASLIGMIACFEGDIVELINRDDTFLIKYDIDDAVWLVSNCNDSLTFRENISNYECIVVGNIYDNPEILPEYLR